MRLIDAENIPYTMLYKENWMKGTGKEEQGAWKSTIDKMPTIDAVPVVRCKECKRWKDPHDGECPYHSSGDPYIDDDPEEDFFCAAGERKDDE